jgi:hypothetical protein
MPHNLTLFKEHFSAKGCYQGVPRIFKPTDGLGKSKQGN